MRYKNLAKFLFSHLLFSHLFMVKKFYESLTGLYKTFLRCIKIYMKFILVKSLGIFRKGHWTLWAHLLPIWESSTYEFNGLPYFEHMFYVLFLFVWSVHTCLWYACLAINFEKILIGKIMSYKKFILSFLGGACLLRWYECIISLS